MALFESYERRIDQINAELAKHGISSIEEAEKIVNGKRVGIAFTSRSFEYYLLLHFEYLYREFQETECGEKVGGKKKIFRCGTDTFPDKDCHGDKCINGYARKQGYWEESKTSKSMFPLVENRLKKGIINGCRLRAESDSVTKEPMYNRNPYTTADLLVGRLMGIETINYGSTYSYIEAGNNLSIVRSGSTLTVKNELSKIAILMMDSMRLTGTCNSSATSSGVGSYPNSCTSCFCT